MNNNNKISNFIIKNGLTRLILDHQQTNYAVHPSGKLYSLNKLKEVTGSKMHNKSTTVHININGHLKTFTRSYLIALTFLTKPSKQHNYVHHINGNNYDDNVNNLEWQNHYNINGEQHILAVGNDINKKFISIIQAARYLADHTNYAVRTIQVKISNAIRGKIRDVYGYQIIALNHQNEKLATDKLFIENINRDEYKKVYYNGLYFPYLINSKGDVYSLLRSKKLKPEYAKLGSLRVRLSLNHKIYIVPIDQLVAQSFKLPKNNDNYIHLKHIDHNNSNNRLNNLVWVSKPNIK